MGCYGCLDISYVILIDVGLIGSWMYIYKFELNRNGKVDSVDDVEELVNFFGKFKLGFLLMFNKLDVIEVYF